MKELIDKIISTDSLPVAGGSVGAVSTLSVESSNFLHFVNHDQILATIVLAAIGAFIGYFVKLGLDELFKKCKNSK